MRMLGAASFCARRRLWCIWFALLMATPYMHRDLSGYASAWGASAFSQMFAWVALGMLVGLWLGSHPWVERRVEAQPCLGKIAAMLGLVVSGVVVVSELLLMLGEMYDWPRVLVENLSAWRGLTAFCRQGPFLVLLASALCGWTGLIVCREYGEGSANASSMAAKHDGPFWACLCWRSL